MKTPTFGRWSMLTIVLGFALVAALSLSAKADETTAAPAVSSPAGDYVVGAVKAGIDKAAAERPIIAALVAAGDKITAEVGKTEADFQSASVRLGASWEALKQEMATRATAGALAAEPEAVRFVEAAVASKVADYQAARAVAAAAAKAVEAAVKTPAPAGIVTK